MIKKTAEEELARVARGKYLSILRYPGGKRRLVSRIGQRMDEAGISRFHRLIEPFAGGASVSIAFLEAGLVDNVVMSDLDPLVSALWKVVFSKNAAELAERVLEADVTLPVWRSLKNMTPEDDMEAAMKCLFLNRTSYSGSLSPHAGPIGGQQQQSDYKVDCRYNHQALAKRILELSRFRQQVAVRNVDFRTLAATYNAAHKRRGTEFSAFWYLDPPFFHKADRLYRKWFDDQDHLALRDVLTELVGEWYLSYDMCPEARSLYQDQPGYDIVDMRYTAHRQSKVQSTKNSEIIVSNFLNRRTLVQVESNSSASA